MSNIAFNFLTESFLFHEAESNYSKRTIDEIDREITTYREYIQKNINQINSEIYKEYNFIQPITLHTELPSIEDLLQGCIFLDTYIIDDPIYRFNIQQFKMGNIERLQMGMPEITDDDIKTKLQKIVIYMKSLTMGVHINVGYIKFYPLGLFLNNYFNPCIRIPDLSIESINQNLFKWFLQRVEIKKIDKNKVNNDMPITNRILLSFKNDDENGSVIRHYQLTSLDPMVGNHAIIKFDGNVIPSKEVYESWVNEETIKFIKDRISFFAYRDFMCNYFNSPICLSTDFEKRLYKTNFDISNKSHYHNLGFNLNLPGLQNISFDKAMEIRNNSHCSFASLQKKIQEDSKGLRAASDYKTYKSIINEIRNDYLTSIKTTNDILKPMKNLFSFNNIINVSLFAESYFTGTTTKVTTGLTILNGIYNAGKIAQDYFDSVKICSQFL